MSILKLAPASVINASASQAVDDLANTTAPLAAQAKYLFSDNADHGSIIVNGSWAGKTLRQYLSDEGWQVLGNDASKYEVLPFTVKSLGDTNQSVYSNASKKNESFWYVMEAAPETFLYFGAKGSFSPEELAAAIEDGSWKSSLQKASAHKDDLFVVDPGTIYAFENGPRILEVEALVPVSGESEDSVYEKVSGDDYHKGDWVADGQAERALAGSNDVFELDLFQVDGRLDMNTDDKSFKLLVFLSGSAVVDADDETLHCEEGSVLFASADSDTFHITGNCKFLLVHLV